MNGEVMSMRLPGSVSAGQPRNVVFNTPRIQVKSV
jgi:hypothetical protein